MSGTFSRPILSLFVLFGCWRVRAIADGRIWHPTKKEARFVEVKGPGDSLSETQKVWIDVLLSAGVPVEVCKVKAKIKGVEDGEDEEGVMAGKRGRAGSRAKSAGVGAGKGVKRKSGDSLGAGTSGGGGADKSKRKEQGKNGWKRVRTGDHGESHGAEGDEEEDGEEEEGEFAYESGEEGKPEGRWEKR